MMNAKNVFLSEFILKTAKQKENFALRKQLTKRKIHVWGKICQVYNRKSILAPNFLKF